jgi:hypothetical protein
MNETDYVCKVLATFRQTPTTSGRATRQDRLLAVELYRRGVPLHVVENALALGAFRRLYRDLKAPPLPPVRSLSYFQNLIQEVLDLKINPNYFDYVRHRVATFQQEKLRFLESQSRRRLSD